MLQQPYMMAMSEVEVILAVLIGVAYAISGAVKAMDRWIQKKRQGRPVPAQPETTPAPPQAARDGRPRYEEIRKPDSWFEGTIRRQDTQQTEAEQPRTRYEDVAESLRRELERAMGGEQAAELQEYAAWERDEKPAQPQPEPVASTPSPFSQGEWGNDITAVRTDATGRRFSATGVRIHDAAIVGRARLSHLAVIREPDDMRRGVLMAEILGPPRAYRYLPRSPFDSR